MAKEKKNQITADAAPAAPAAAPVAEKAPGLVMLLSLRPGPIVTSTGTVEYKGKIEVPAHEAEALVKMFPGMIQPL